LQRPWHSRALCEWHYWLSTVGIVVMFLDLTMAGVFQGFTWSAMEPWDASTDVSYPFWVVRVFAGLGMAGGLGCFAYNLYRTWQASRRAAIVT
jgi:cytochrome c oxidase cbb3-type subunit 1